MSFPLFNDLYWVPDLLIPSTTPEPQVEVNWENPITEGFVGCYIFNDFGETIKDLTGIMGDGDTNNTGVIESRHGRILELNGSSQYARIPTINLPANDISILITFELDTNTDEMLLGCNNASNMNACDIYVSGNDLQWWIMGSSLEVQVDNVMTTGVLHTAVCTRTGSVQKIHLNGQSPVVGPSNSTTIVPDGNTFLVGADADSGAEGNLGNYANGRVRELFFFNRGLSDGEAFDLTFDPQQVLRAKTAGVWLPNIPVADGVNVDSWYTIKENPVLMKNEVISY